MMQKIIKHSIYLVILCLPLYLIRFSIWHIPTNVLELIIGLSFLIWLLIIVKEKRILRINLLQKNKKALTFIVMLFYGVTLSTIWSKNLTISAGIWKSWFVIPLMFFVLIINSIKKEDINRIILLFLSSGFVVSVISIIYWFKNILTYDGRLQAFYLSPNHLAMFLSPIFIISIYLYFSIKKTILKMILFFTQIFLLFIIYLTNSYGALLAIIGTMFFLFFMIWFARFAIKVRPQGPTSEVRPRRSEVVFVILLCVILFSFVILQAPTNKFRGIMDSTYPSLKSRLVIWRSADAIIKNNYLLGIGPGMFQEYYLSYQNKFNPYPEWAVPQPHNIFLAFWLQGGIIGLIGFLLLMVYLIYKNIKNKTAVLLILTAVLICILLHGLIDTTYWKNDLSVFFWIIIALNCIENRQVY